MSRQLRQKILTELTSTRGGKTSAEKRRKREQWVKDYFDNGQLRLTRKHWSNTYSEALSRIEGQARHISTRQITIKEWGDIHKFVNTELRKIVDKNICILSDIKRDTDTITVVYRRGAKRSLNEAQETVDLERYITDKLRKVMESFFKTGKFKDLVKNTIIESAPETGNRDKGMTLSHGSTTEPFFGSAGTDTRRATQKQIEGTLTDGVQTAPGAKGTLISKQMIVAIAEECEKTFNTTQFFTSAFEVIHAKWDDMFGYSSNVIGEDTKTRVQDEVRLTAELIPTKILRLQKLNRGVFDKAISQELQKFLENEDYFATEIVRLKPNLHNQVQSITTGSDTTRQRIEKAAIQAVELEILENLTDKVVKRRRKKSTLKRKKGSSKTNYKSTSRSSRKQTTKNAATRRGRPTKRQQAIGGNVIALKELINQQLPSRILTKMQAPALVNRTGRFRHSAEVTNVAIGPRGGTQIDYTYQRNPYEVFEPGSGSPLANQYRDPRRIIGGTIREIAQQIMSKKFITVRRV